MTDELQAALARAEAAEAEVKQRDLIITEHDSRWRHWYAEFIAAERQRDEAWTAGAEAMREACAKKAKIAWLSFGYGEIADADLTSQLCEYAESLIRALPIPAQEVK